MPWIPTAPAIVPPATDPKIVASPALAENRPCAVPPSAAGSLAAMTVTPPTKAQANPSPSNGAISTSTTGSIDDRGEDGSDREHDAPTTINRSVPNRAPSRGKAYISGTSITAPNAQVNADQAGVAAEGDDLDRVEGVDGGEGRPHDREARQEQQDPGGAQDLAGTAQHADRARRPAAADGGRHQDRADQAWQVDPEERARSASLEQQRRRAGRRSRRQANRRREPGRIDPCPPGPASRAFEHRASGRSRPGRRTAASSRRASSRNRTPGTG